MKGKEIVRLYEFNARALSMNTDGLTHDDSLVAPPSGGSNANWVLGHIVATRNIALTMAGLESIWDKERNELYDRHAPPVTEPTAVALQDLLTDFGLTQETLLAHLRDRSDDELRAPLDEPSENFGRTISDALAAFSLHEAYHIGQLGVLRRMIGKDAGIS